MPRVSDAYLAGRRRQIIDAARRCFAREGFHQASMQDIVQESGLSPGAIYRYFKSKVEIVEAIARERHRRERDLMSAALEGSPGIAAIRELAHRFLESLERPDERQDRRVGVQLWAEALRNTTLLKLVKDGVEQPHAILAGIFRSARARGELPRALDPDAAARLTIAVFHGVLLQKVWNPRLPTQPILEAIDLLLRGFQKPD